MSSPILTVATLLTDRKLYANQIFFPSLLRQGCVEARTVRLIVVVDDLSPDSLAYAREFAKEHGDQFPRGITVIPSYPLFESGYTWASGRHALLRQQALDCYLSLAPDSGLVWWDADQDWSDDFLHTCGTCGHPIASGIYLLRHSRNPALFQVGAPWHLPDHHVVQGGPAFLAGLGGTWASYAEIKRFSDMGGWKTFGRDATGIPLTTYQAEDAYFFSQLGLPIPVLTEPWCWHWEGDERDGEKTPRYAQAARVRGDVLDRFRKSDGGVVRAFDTEPRQGERPYLSVATLVHDIRADAAALFVDALLAQDYPKHRVHLLVCIDVESPVCRFFFDQWRQSVAASEFASVTVWEANAPTRRDMEDSQWWTNRIAILRQEVLERYLRRQPYDDGLLWWDADTCWDTDFIRRVIACGWPLVQGIYAARGHTFPCILRYHTLRKVTEAVHHWSLWHNYTNNYATYGGFYACRDFWDEFEARGGWRGYRFTDNLGEDGYPLLLLGRETYILPRVGAWHVQGDGTATRVDAIANGRYVGVRRHTDGRIEVDGMNHEDKAAYSERNRLINDTATAANPPLAAEETPKGEEHENA